MHWGRLQRNGHFGLKKGAFQILEKMPHKFVDSFIRKNCHKMIDEEIVTRLLQRGIVGVNLWNVKYRRRKLGVKKYFYGEIQKHKAWVRLQAIKKYGKKDYWLLKFPKEETRQYMYRAVVMKEIMENLEKYGFPAEECRTRYAPDLKFVKKRIFKAISGAKLAEEWGMEYLEFLELNPVYKNKEIFYPGTYWFILPATVKEK